MFHELLLGKKWKRASNSSAIIELAENFARAEEKTQTQEKNIRSTRMFDRRVRTMMAWDQSGIKDVRAKTL